MVSPGLKAIKEKSPRLAREIVDLATTTLVSVGATNLDRRDSTSHEVQTRLRRLRFLVLQNLQLIIYVEISQCDKLPYLQINLGIYENTYLLVFGDGRSRVLSLPVLLVTMALR